MTDSATLNKVFHSTGFMFF